MRFDVVILTRCIIYIYTQILHNLLLDTIAMLRIARFLHENVLKIRLTDPVCLNLNLTVKGRARTWLCCQIKTEVVFATSYKQNGYTDEEIQRHHYKRYPDLFSLHI